jgi:hypothetical protein
MQFAVRCELMRNSLHWPVAVTQLHGLVVKVAAFEATDAVRLTQPTGQRQSRADAANASAEPGSTWQL